MSFAFQNPMELPPPRTPLTSRSKVFMPQMQVEMNSSPQYPEGPILEAGSRCAPQQNCRSMMQGHEAQHGIFFNGHQATPYNSYEQQHSYGEDIYVSPVACPVVFSFDPPSVETSGQCVSRKCPVPSGRPQRPAERTMSAASTKAFTEDMRSEPSTDDAGVSSDDECCDAQPSPDGQDRALDLTLSSYAFADDSQSQSSKRGGRPSPIALLPHVGTPSSSPSCPKSGDAAGTPSSWAAQQKNYHQTNSGEKHVHVVRAVRGILNKLTQENFDIMYIQLVGSGISRPEHVKIVVDEIFSKASSEHSFVKMYAELCSWVHAWLSDGHGKLEDPRIFKRTLLAKCQENFETHLRAPQDFSDLDPDERAEAQLKWKIEMLGTFKFIGALLEKGTLASRILLLVTTSLLKDPTPSSLECLSVFLTSIGPCFDNKEWCHYSELSEVFEQVRSHRRNTDLPSRTRFLLQDVLDLRTASWKKADKAAKPTTPARRTAA